MDPVSIHYVYLLSIRVMLKLEPIPADFKREVESPIYLRAITETWSVIAFSTYSINKLSFLLIIKQQIVEQMAVMIQG